MQLLFKGHKSQKMNVSIQNTENNHIFQHNMHAKIKNFVPQKILNSITLKKIHLQLN